MPLCRAGMDGALGHGAACDGAVGYPHVFTGLGFVTGAKVQIISDNGDNLIVQAHDSRVAISRDMALHIHL